MAERVSTSSTPYRVTGELRLMLVASYILFLLHSLVYLPVPASFSLAASHAGVALGVVHETCMIRGS